MLERLNNPNTIIIIGRSHSGTRILPEAMKAAGIYMGTPLNVASDLLPVKEIYEACRIFGKFVDKAGRYEWDFSRALSAEIPIRFKQLLESYLQPIIESESKIKGWKLPESTLIYPWLTRLLPNATFIFWVRHPEGSCGRMCATDRLERWNIPARRFLFHDFNYKMRAVSWKYHYDIVMDTPRPERFMQMRYEDYVLKQEENKSLVENFIGAELALLPLIKTKAGPHSKKYHKYSFLAESLRELIYV